MDIHRTDALLVIDIQNDFCPAANGIGGALAVAGGHEIVPLVNTLAQRFSHVLLTQDWHPTGHISELILRKGFRPEIDSYSAFLENDHTTPTGLAGYLRERGLKRLFLCGLAYDFCVRFSAVDGTALGFECLVIEDATRAVNLPGSVEATNAAFASDGIPRILSVNLLAP
jgi:nicotinamidase/pyrazinamidase